MTYIQIINILNELCSSLPDVNTVVREFLDLNREDTLYSAMVVQDRDGARTDYTYQSYNEFTFYIGYVDRLTPSKDNVDDIVSTGINHINTLISSLEELDITVSSSSLVSFTQRFTAECAGVYLGITLSVPVDCTIPSIHIGDCKTEPKEETITHNGSFTFIPEGEVIGFSKFTVNVDVPERKPEESLDTTITSNGDYTYNPKEGQVFDSVRVNVDVPYKPEKELTDLITSNGTHTYTPEENEVYNSVKINVEVHPEEKLEETITTNGNFQFEGEWKNAGITVAVPIPEQKEEVELSGTITKNGITYYTPEENQTYKSAVITTDIHPSESLNETITSNGSFSYPGEYNGVEIKVDVPSVAFTDIPGMKYGYSGQLPDGYIISPRSGLRQCEYMFYEYSGSSVPYFDTFGIESMFYMFYNSYIKSLPKFDVGNVKNMEYFCYFTGYLKDNIQLDLHSATNCRHMFDQSGILTIEVKFNPIDIDPEYVQSTDVNVDNMLSQCYDLTSIIFHDVHNMYNVSKLFGSLSFLNFTEFLIDGHLNDNIDLNTNKQLTYDSVKSILTSGTQSVVSGQTPLTMTFHSQTITDQDGEIASLIAYCVKIGWTISGLTIQ